MKLNNCVDFHDMTWLHINKAGLTNIQPSLILVQSRSQTTAIIINIFDNFNSFPYYSKFKGVSSNIQAGFVACFRHVL